MPFLYKKIILVVIQVLQIQSPITPIFYNSFINYIRIDEFIKYIATTIYIYTIILNNKIYILYIFNTLHIWHCDWNYRNIVLTVTVSSITIMILTVTIATIAFYYHCVDLILEHSTIQFLFVLRRFLIL